MNDLPKVTEAELLNILAIAHETSSNGKGVSLHDARAQARYRELRPHFDASDLLALVMNRPHLVEQWLAYSERKRTDGGWFLETHGWMSTSTGERYRSRSRPKAVAEYVIRELDWWSERFDGGTNQS